MQLLPVQQRKIRWTRSLKQTCRLLKRHKDGYLAEQASGIHRIVAGRGELNMKRVEKSIKFSICSLPLCKRDDGELPENFQVCARCKVAKYCSREHQVEHWIFHKLECNKHH